MARQRIIPAEKMLWSDEQFQNFQKIWSEPIKPFDIVIRRQVADSKKKKSTVDFGDTKEVEIGDYFHFHNHTIYSTLAATSHFNELIKVAAENDFKAVGMVDLGNLMGAFKFVSEVEKYNEDIKKRKPKQKKR